MRVLLINSVCGIRSTGRLCTDLAERFEAQGHEVKIAYGRYDVPERCRRFAVRVGSVPGVYLNGIRARLSDREGRCARFATERFLKWAEKFDPDLLWLHNLHGYYLNYELLFRWIKSRPQMEVRWTLHDCWAMTGHCAHFSFVRCDKWKRGCEYCPQRKEYPASCSDRSAENYRRKKNAFCGVKKMELIAPSQWLADQVKESFLREYPVTVCRNTVDGAVFCPTPGDFRERYGLIGKKIVLGVSGVWNVRKGLDDFLRLSEILPEEYAVVLVGLTKKQIAALPSRVTAIRHTDGVKELAEIYTAADVFVNLTYEDTYPTVNLEAAACGTPVITYRTGGSVESVLPERIAEQGDLDGIVALIRSVCADPAPESGGKET